MNASPIKRRVLGSLDVNAPSPNSRPTQSKDAKLASLSPQKPGISLAPATKTAPESELQKRQSAMPDGEPPAKKACRSTPERELQSAALGQQQRSAEAQQTAQRDTDRQQSASPAASSVFDESTLDTSQATNITEPDHDVAIAAAVTAQLPPVAPRPRRRMTHAESKEAAERLRLRFALARYKVATGQTDVPLEQLQRRPMPGATRRVEPQLSRPASERHASPSSSSDSSSHDDEEEEEEVIANSQQSVTSAPRRPLPNFASPEKSALPRLPPTSAVITPRRKQIEEEDDKLTSSAIRGGAANGLLSLSLARS